MKEVQLESFKEWFKEYTSQFYTGDDDYDYNIRFKVEHTKRVCNESLMICNSLSASKQTQILAETIALFHDVGRFQQFAKYKTFMDKDSVNHAHQGVRDLNRHKVLSGCTKQERYLISNAVAFHNSLKMPEKDDETLLYIKMIRDADKLDIWNVCKELFSNKKNINKSIILHLPDKPEYSPQVVQSILNGNGALYSQIKTLNDYKIIQMGWVFDLNFPASFLALKKRGIISGIIKTLPQTKDIQILADKIHNYIEDKVITEK